MVGLALLVATQNYYILLRAGRPVPWTRLAVGELPVWLTWLGLFPVIRRLALRYPPVGRGHGRYIALHLLAALSCTFLMILVVTAVRTGLPGMLPEAMGYWEAVRRGFTSLFVVFLPIYGVLVTGLLAWSYYRDTQERSLQESRLEAALASARLESLRDQLHPHFLFNTLHAISALMAEDVPGARKMMRRLSELLRIALEDGTHEVPLHEELAILELYVQIQQIRFGDRLTVRYDVDPRAEGVLVPRLFLQPLVENAIKYAASGHDPAVIGIGARLDDGSLLLEVTDNGPGFPDSPGPRSYGIGLTNTEARLEQLYGEAFALELHNRPEGGALVRIAVPVRAATPAGGTG